MSRLMRLRYERAERKPWWLEYAWTDYARDEVVMLPFPLNWVARAARAFWIGWRRFNGRPTMIDKAVSTAVEQCSRGWARHVEVIETLAVKRSIDRVRREESYLADLFERLWLIVRELDREEKTA